jgi:hypothetical protein
MGARSGPAALLVAGVLTLTLAVGGAVAAGLALTPGPGSPIPVGTNPHSIAVSDFNLDGKFDVATSNVGSDNVSILRGNGHGGFSPGTPIPVGHQPHSLATGFFNRDLRPDLVVANSESDTISVLLGTGSGGFTAGPTLPGGDGPWYISVGFLNRDLKLDLAVANVLGDTVSIFLGTGDGGFTAAPSVPVGHVPYGIAIADLNRDGKADLGVANQFAHTVSILLGDGTGGFTPAPGSPVTVANAPSWVKAADLNRDGKLDLAVTSQGTDAVTILLGDGAGGFTPAPGSPVPVASDCVRPGHACGPTPLAVVDLNRDGKLDLVTGNIFSDNASVLLGDGSGGFSPAPGSPFAVGDGPFALAVADLNWDFRPDLAVTGYNSSDVTVLLSRPSS